MIPDPIPSPFPGAAHVEPLNLQPVIDAESLAGYLDQVISQKSSSLIESIETILADCDDCLTGHFERRIPEVESLLSKFDGKLEKQMVGTLSEAYRSMSEVGLPFPSDEEVIYHQMTGELAPEGFMGETTVAHPEPPKEPIPQPPPGPDIPKFYIDFPPVPPRGKIDEPPEPPKSPPYWFNPLPQPPPRPLPPYGGPLPPVPPAPPGGPVPRGPFGGPVPPRQPLPWPPWIPIPTPIPIPLPGPPHGYPIPPGMPIPPPDGPMPYPPGPLPPEPSPPGPMPVPPSSGGPLPPIPSPSPSPPAGPVPQPKPTPPPPIATCDPGAKPQGYGSAERGPCTVLATAAMELTDEERRISNLIKDVVQQFIWPIVAGWCGPMRVVLDSDSWVNLCGQNVTINDTVEGGAADDGTVEKKDDPKDFPKCGPANIQRPSAFVNYLLKATCIADKWIVNDFRRVDDDNLIALTDRECVIGWYPTPILAGQAQNSWTNNQVGLVKLLGTCAGGQGPGAVPKQLIKLPDWSAINWDSEDVCKQIEKVAESIGSADSETFAKILGLLWDDGTVRTPPWLEKVAAALPPSWQKALSSGLNDAAQALWSWLDALPPINDCKTKENAIPIIVKGMLSIIQRWTGFDTSDISVPYDLWYQWSCPFELPSGPEIHTLKSRGFIDWKTMECLVRANGLLPNWQHMIQLAGQPWPSMESIGWARSLGEITAEQWTLYKERAGYGGDDVFGRWLGTSWQPVSQTDLVQFMERDAADEKNIDWKAADKEFDDKFTGKLKDWANGVRVHPDVMRYHWRSHYRLPSPGQLYEMLHRLRKGDVPDKVVTTQDDVLRTLGQNDVHPDWRERLVAISYAPLTRTDVKRAYFSGDLEYDDVFKAYLDIGYSHPNAGVLADFARSEKKRKTANHRAIKLYRRGGISRQDVVSWLQADKVPADVYTPELDFADAERKAASKRACLAGIRRAFRRGEVREADIPNMVSLLGFSTEEGLEYQTLWTCERESTSKVIPAAKLCEWYQFGLLSPKEMHDRLVNLNYDDTDAWTITRLCHLKHTGSELDMSPYTINEPLPPSQRKGGGKAAKGPPKE